MVADWKAYAAGLAGGLEVALESADERESREYCERLERLSAVMRVALKGQQAMNAMLRAEAEAFAAIYPVAADALKLGDMPYADEQ